MLVLLVLGLLPFVSAVPDCESIGPICDYVQRDDGYFSYELIATYPQENIDTYVLNMTSQRWKDETVSNHDIWWHYVTIHIPHEIRFTDRAFLYVGGSNNNAGPPNTGSGHIRETGVYAERTGMVTGVVRQTPNQPVRMANTEVDRSEDGLIAYTWRLFMDSDPEEEDPEVLLRFPMCKGAKRAFDAMQEFVLEQTGNQLEKYMAAGESKRGWTVWLLGPTDDRVEAMAPVVLTMLNVNENIHHYYQSLGNWPFAFGDYWLHNITSYVDDPRVFDLEEQVDPIRYREWLRMPKLIVSGASDEFFMPDDYDYFFDDLFGPKFIWLLENTGHSIGGSPLNAEYWRMLETFYLAVILEHPVPEFSWEKDMDDDGGWVILTTDEPISEISVFSALTPPIVRPRRDFRMFVLSGIDVVNSEIEWIESPVENLGDGQYRAYFEHPDDDGYLAFFIKVTFPWEEEGRTFTFTSEAQILPGGFSFEPCTGPACRGFLV